MKIKVSKVITNILVIGAAALLTSCTSIRPIQDGGPKYDIDVSKIPNAVPKSEPFSRYGNPSSYVVNGRRYYVLSSCRNYNKKGIASWYGTKFNGQLTSTHDIYDMYGMTAASTELPIPCYAQVTNLENGRRVIVKVNDRGPFDRDRILDLSYAAAKKLGYLNKGTALVQVKTIDPTTWGKPQHKLEPTRAPTPHTTYTKISHTPKIYLQIGAFSQRPNANQLCHRISLLIGTGNRVAVIKGIRRHKPIYRVQIGPLQNPATSDKIQKMLAAHRYGKALTLVK